MPTKHPRFFYRYTVIVRGIRTRKAEGRRTSKIKIVQGTFYAFSPHEEKRFNLLYKECVHIALTEQPEWVNVEVGEEYAVPVTSDESVGTGFYRFRFDIDDKPRKDLWQWVKQVGKILKSVVRL